MVDVLQGKLEQKAYSNAELYHKTGNYKSATLAMEHAIKDFLDPRTKKICNF